MQDEKYIILDGLPDTEECGKNLERLKEATADFLMNSRFDEEMDRLIRYFKVEVQFAMNDNREARRRAMSEYRCRKSTKHKNWACMENAEKDVLPESEYWAGGKRRHSAGRSSSVPPKNVVIK